MRLLPASLLLILISWSPDQSAKSAVEQFRNLRATLRASHTANAWQTNLIAANELKRLLNENPEALLEVARAEVHLGNFNAAFHEVEQFGHMGQFTDLTAPALDFSALYDKPEFAQIQSGLEANRTPISLGSTAFLLPDASVLAEDVDYDETGHRFLITSVRQRKITALGQNGSGDDFARAPDDWPMMAIKIDPRRGLVWATEVAIQDFSFAPEADWGRSAILCYDLRTGKLLRRVEGARGSSLGDMALSSNGDVVVSDGNGGGIYRLSAKSQALERIDSGDFISPQTPAMHPDGKHIFVPDYERGIAILDPSMKRVRWLATFGRFALNGIDGLYFARGKLFAVQNGTSPERVIAFTLDATLSRVQSEEVLERSTSTLGDPTHGVVVGKNFYYLANSGWDTVDDHGNLRPGTKPSVPRMMKVELGQ